MCEGSIEVPEELPRTVEDAVADLDSSTAELLKQSEQEPLTDLQRSRLGGIVTRLRRWLELNSTAANHP